VLQTAECIGVTAGGPLSCIWLVERRLKGVCVCVCKKNILCAENMVREGGLLRHLFIEVNNGTVYDQIVCRNEASAFKEKKMT
jgi:hypothetical protein